MTKARLIAGLDIGSGKVCAIAGEVTAGGIVRILHAGISRSRGIQHGVVVDLDAAGSTVSRALAGLNNWASRAGHGKILSLVLGTSLPVASLNNRGTVVPHIPRRSLTREDVRRAVAAAAEPGLPATRQIVHAIPRHFVVDGQTDVVNPVGLYGRRVDADVHLVTVTSSAMDDLIGVVEQHGLEVEEVVVQGMASAEAVLAPEERELGVVLAEVGEGSTTVTVFVDGAPCHTATIVVCGRHITQDIATVLGIGFDESEYLKLSAGHALASTVAPPEELAVTSLGGGVLGNICRHDLCEIIEARATELIRLIDQEIDNSGFAGLLPAGLVLTGGTAELPGIARLASEHLQVRVRVGQALPVDELNLGGFDLGGPAFASVAGMVLWTLRKPRWWSYPGRAVTAGSPSRRAFSLSRIWRSLVTPLPSDRRSKRN